MSERLRTGRWAILALGVLLVGALPACAQPRDAAPEDERLIGIADIDGDAISLGLFKKTYVAFLIATGMNDTEAHRQQHLANLVDAYLLAAHERQRGGARDSAYQAYLRRQEKKALGGRFYEVAVLDSVDAPDDATTRVAYAQFTDRVHLRQLYFRRLGDAEAAYRRLESGEDFVDLANEVYRTPAYDSTAGDIGAVAYFGIDDALAEAAFTLRERYAYTPPIQSRVGYHILRLENRITNPIRTESAYQAKRVGIGQELRLRQMRMAGDAYVRDLMAGTDYQVHPEAMYALREAVQRLERRVGPRPFDLAAEEDTFSPIDRQQIQTGLTPETVLVTYTWDGHRRTFTALDYFGWMEELPFAEARANPAASVGRALRNEVLALAGEAAGLRDDPIFREAVRHEGVAYLANERRRKLRQDSTYRPTPEMLERAFERLSLHRKRSVTVDFWMIPAGSREDAEYIQSLIETGEQPADAFAGYRAFASYDVARDRQWMRTLRQSPLGAPIVVGMAGPQWFVFEIAARHEQSFRFEDVRDDLARQLAPLAGEAMLLDSLYRQATIQVDSLRIAHLVK